MHTHIEHSFEVLHCSLTALSFFPLNSPLLSLSLSLSLCLSHSPLPFSLSDSFSLPFYVCLCLSVCLSLSLSVSLCPSRSLIHSQSTPCIKYAAYCYV